MRQHFLHSKPHQKYSHLVDLIAKSEAPGQRRKSPQSAQTELVAQLSWDQPKTDVRADQKIT